MALFAKETFESGSIPGTLTPYADTGNTIAIDATSKVNGTDSVKVTIGAVGSCFLTASISSSSSAYIMFSIYVPSSFDWGSGTYMGLVGFTTTGPLKCYFNLENTGDGALSLTFGGASPLSYHDTGLDIPQGQISTVQVYFKEGASSTGAVKVWLNNTNSASPSYSNTTLTTNTSVFNEFEIGNLYADGAITSPYYFDDVSADTSFIGSTTGSISQVGSVLTLSGGTQSVVSFNPISISQSAVALTLTGGVQTVVTKSSISQIAASLTASGGTQSVVTVQIASIFQSTAFLFVTNGVQVILSNQVGSVSFIQSAANLTVNSGTESIDTVGIRSVSQVTCNLTLTGGTQTIQSIRNTSVTQLSANLSLTGRTQVVATISTGIVSQVASNLTIIGGTQIVGIYEYISISQSAATITLNSGMQIIASSEGITTKWSQSSKEDTAWTDSTKETSKWSDSVKKDTTWTGSNAQESDWSSDTNIHDIILIDDLVCLVDDPVVFVAGYNPLLHSPIENINESLWS